MKTEIKTKNPQGRPRKVGTDARVVGVKCGKLTISAINKAAELCSLSQGDWLRAVLLREALAVCDAHNISQKDL